MALTLDDYPLAESSAPSHSRCEAMWSALRDALRAHHAPCTWFVVAGAVDDRAARFLDTTADVGNHTAQHLALTDVAAHEFLRDVDSADRKLAHWLSAPKLFRYPYLREGESHAKQEQVRDGLAARGYVNATATIAPRDWEYDALPLTEELVGRYIMRVEEEARRACTIARDIPHVLVLHVNALNATAFAPLLAALAPEWEFVSLRDALADPFYRQTVPPSGIGVTLLEAI
jgi:peptidoglycan/xylan/chitin deacetylase (PgdA/CDA1 family)